MKENPIVNQKNLASSFFSIDIIQTILALLSAKHTAQWLHRECNCSFNIHLIDKCKFLPFIKTYFLQINIELKFEGFEQLNFVDITLPISNLSI